MFSCVCTRTWYVISVLLFRDSSTKFKRVSERKREIEQSKTHKHTHETCPCLRPLLVFILILILIAMISFLRSFESLSTKIGKVALTRQLPIRPNERPVERHDKQRKTDEQRHGQSHTTDVHQHIVDPVLERQRHNKATTRGSGNRANDIDMMVDRKC